MSVGARGRRECRDVKLRRKRISAATQVKYPIKYDFFLALMLATRMIPREKEGGGQPRKTAVM